LPEGDAFPFQARLWRFGDAVWVALNGEHYNYLQRKLRGRFPQTPIVVGTLANGSSVSYLVDDRSHDKGLYQENVSVLARGSLETLEKAIAREIRALLDDRARSCDR
jgi:hypothetical protein